ncbi:MAG: DNA repair protein RecO [Owenweeksia sp. TMED14]|nr:MAG: DNA repair protein RecO [Owenweeksia sp. TMED14]|tara:strand:- start:3161 stop:3868 length:708 start_codon:yes stop_codon:yes gene_type:complete
MKDTTLAIVLGKIAVGEKGYVLRMWTRKYGPQAYMIHSIRGNKNGIRPAMLLPMTALNATVSHKNRGHLEKIIEIETAQIWERLATDHVRQSLCLFSAEVLHKTLQDGDSSPQFFDDFIKMLNRWDNAGANLGMSINEILLMIWRYLGFTIDGTLYNEGSVLDLREGNFVHNVPLHDDFLSKETSRALANWICGKTIKTSKKNRVEITDGLIIGLRWHYPTLGTLNSLEILRSLS